MSEQLKLEFIQRTLNGYMEEVSQRMKQLSDRQSITDTGAGKNSISHHTTKTGNGYESRLYFAEYLRQIDMGTGRGHPLGGLKQVTLTLKVNKGGNALVKDNVRKAKPFYSKTAYGKLTPLYNRLLYGFTQETIDLLTAELLNKPTPQP